MFTLSYRLFDSLSHWSRQEETKYLLEPFVEPNVEDLKMLKEDADADDVLLKFGKEDWEDVDKELEEFLGSDWSSSPEDEPLSNPEPLLQPDRSDLHMPSDRHLSYSSEIGIDREDDGLSDLLDSELVKALDDELQGLDDLLDDRPSKKPRV